MQHFIGVNVCFPAWPFVEKRTALNHINTQKKTEPEPGIVDECCKKGCSFATLERYCADPPADAPSTPSMFSRFGSPAAGLRGFTSPRTGFTSHPAGARTVSASLIPAALPTMVENLEENHVSTLLCLYFEIVDIIPA